MGDSAKDRLVRWLDQHAFEPVLRKNAEHYSGKQRETFDHVRRATESEKRRFQGYESAQKVRQMFLDDLSSAPARRIDRELAELGLPKLPDLKDEFLRLCDQMGVE